MRLLALVMAFMVSTAHAADPADASCRSSTIAKVRQQALAESHAAGRSKAFAALAAYDRLKPALDAGCLESTRLDSPSVRPMNQDAIAYAWLLNGASAYLIAADALYDAPQDESGGPACLGVLQPLLGDDTRQCLGMPRNLGAAIAANVLQYGPVASPHLANRPT
ncbi:hypothetical protein [Burkholderia sp. S-53]|uniref:hypothetical protein n=1 Tax=Burkholderia sp. S-53 TaxID=2906514 RepID=UPI0021CEDCF8|nr:hypothetical protein [Burkholderia sp. S-53]UXU88108.1 hypothetical protein LXM88_06495 [Burkholderia sp. S-53]